MAAHRAADGRSGNIVRAPRAPQQTVATIEIRVQSWAQLFEPLDPLPVRERALDRSAESYILACAGEHPVQQPVRLLIHCPESWRMHVAGVAEGIHEHFRSAHAQGEKRFRRRLRVGGVLLGVGLAILGAAIAIRSLLRGVEGSALAQGLGEGLLILGWVAMWRPVDILLFEHWESHLDHAMLDRLARIPVEFSFRPDAALRGKAESRESRRASS